MYEITREVSFSYGHRLMDYEGKCARLHGHNGHLKVTLAAKELDSSGMVVDFQEIKNAVSRWIEETLDHRVILRRDDPIATALEAIGEVVYVVDFNPTAENIVKHVFEHLAATGLPIAEVSLDETDNCSASYRMDL